MNFILAFALSILFLLGVLLIAMTINLIIETLFDLRK